VPAQAAARGFDFGQFGHDDLVAGPENKSPPGGGL
jgi:hypothetical protein